MDLQQIIAQFFQQAASDPSHLEAFGNNPVDALKNATGLDLNEDQISGAVEAIGSMLSGHEGSQGIDLGALGDMASNFLKEGGSDILGAISGLLGGNK